MGKNTEIAWCDHSWNPWQGCKKISMGCAKCYMFRDKKRFGQDPEKVIRSKDATFYKPLSWKEPAKIFVCSWSDFWIDEADGWRDEAWEVMRKCPHLTFLLLTKRHEKLPLDGYPKNVWVGVTAENQEQFEIRTMYLSVIDAPVKFISVEPMLGPISIFNHRNDIDWVICGGESDLSKARPMEVSWAEDLLNQCQEDGIPFFMKQMAGNRKKDREAIPEHLQVRQFPGCFRRV